MSDCEHEPMHCDDETNNALMMSKKKKKRSSADDDSTKKRKQRARSDSESSGSESDDDARSKKDGKQANKSTDGLKQGKIQFAPSSGTSKSHKDGKGKSSSAKRAKADSDSDSESDDDDLTKQSSKAPVKDDTMSKKPDQSDSDSDSDSDDKPKSKSTPRKAPRAQIKRKNMKIANELISESGQEIGCEEKTFTPCGRALLAKQHIESQRCMTGSRPQAKLASNMISLFDTFKHEVYKTNTQPFEPTMANNTLLLLPRALSVYNTTSIMTGFLKSDDGKYRPIVLTTVKRTRAHAIKSWEESMVTELPSSVYDDIICSSSVVEGNCSWLVGCQYPMLIHLIMQHFKVVECIDAENEKDILSYMGSNAKKMAKNALLLHMNVCIDPENMTTVDDIITRRQFVMFGGMTQEQGSACIFDVLKPTDFANNEAFYANVAEPYNAWKRAHNKTLLPIQGEWFERVTNSLSRNVDDVAFATISSRKHFIKWMNNFFALSVAAFKKDDEQLMDLFLSKMVELEQETGAIPLAYAKKPPGKAGNSKSASASETPDKHQGSSKGKGSATDKPDKHSTKRVKDSQDVAGKTEQRRKREEQQAREMAKALMPKTITKSCDTDDDSGEDIESETEIDRKRAAKKKKKAARKAKSSKSSKSKKRDSDDESESENESDDDDSESSYQDESEEESDDDDSEDEAPDNESDDDDDARKSKTKQKTVTVTKTTVAPMACSVSASTDESVKQFSSEFVQTMSVAKDMLLGEAPSGSKDAQDELTKDFVDVERSFCNASSDKNTLAFATATRSLINKLVLLSSGVFKQQGVDDEKIKKVFCLSDSYAQTAGAQYTLLHTSEQIAQMAKSLLETSKALQVVNDNAKQIYEHALGDDDTPDVDMTKRDGSQGNDDAQTTEDKKDERDDQEDHD